MAESVLNPWRYPRAALHTRPADGICIASKREEKGTVPPSYVKRTLTNTELSLGISLTHTVVSNIMESHHIWKFLYPSGVYQRKVLATATFKMIRTIITHASIGIKEIACFWLCFPTYSLSNSMVLFAQIPGQGQNMTVEGLRKLQRSNNLWRVRLETLKRSCALWHVFWERGQQSETSIHHQNSMMEWWSINVTEVRQIYMIH